MSSHVTLVQGTDHFGQPHYGSDRRPRDMCFAEGVSRRAFDTVAGPRAFDTVPSIIADHCDVEGIDARSCDMHCGGETESQAFHGESATESVPSVTQAYGIRQ